MWIPSCITRAILSAWQDEWTCKQGNKFKAVKPFMTVWQSSCRAMRREEVIVTWLWIGYTCLTRECSLFGEQAPDCPHSSSLLSFPCILIKCWYYSQQHYHKVCCTVFCKWPWQYFRSCEVCYQYWSCTVDINVLSVLWILVFQLSHKRNVFCGFIALICVWMLRVW